MRSNDLIRGTPYNLVQFTMLQEFVAGCVGAECGAYTHVVDSLHAYSTDLNKHGLEPRSPSGPCLKFSLPKKEAFEALCLMERFLLGACQPEAKLRLLKTLLDDLPTAHKSMMLIAAADLARRRKDPELVSALVSECKDPVLSEAWERWNRRCSNQAMSYEYYIA